jgi:hypothetical protein
MTTINRQLAALLLVFTPGCDKVWTIEGIVHVAHTCLTGEISDVDVSISCPSHRGDGQVRTTQLGHFLYSKVDSSKYEDGCRIHLEKEGFEAVDVTLRSVKVGQKGQTVFVRIALMPTASHSERPEDAPNHLAPVNRKNPDDPQLVRQPE